MSNVISNSPFKIKKNDYSSDGTSQLLEKFNSFLTFGPTSQNNIDIVHLFTLTNSLLSNENPYKNPQDYNVSIMQLIHTYIRKLNILTKNIKSKKNCDDIRRLISQNISHKENKYSTLLLKITLIKFDLIFPENNSFFTRISTKSKLFLNNLVELESLFKEKGLLTEQNHLMDLLSFNFFQDDEIKIIYELLLMHKSNGIPFIITEILSEESIEDQNKISLIYSLIQNIKRYGEQLHATAYFLASNPHALKRAGSHGYINVKNNHHIDTPFLLHLNCVETIIKKFYDIQDDHLVKKSKQEIRELIEYEMIILKELSKVNQGLSTGEDLTTGAHSELKNANAISNHHASFIAETHMLAFYGSFGEDKEKNVLGQMKLVQKILNRALQIYAHKPGELTNATKIDDVLNILKNEKEFSTSFIAKVKKYNTYIESYTRFGTFYLKKTREYREWIQTGKNSQFTASTNKNDGDFSAPGDKYLIKKFVPHIDCIALFQKMLDVPNLDEWKNKLNDLKKIFINRYGLVDGENNYLKAINNYTFKYKNVRGTLFLHFLSKINESKLDTNKFSIEFIENWQPPSLSYLPPKIKEFYPYLPLESGFNETYNYIHQTIKNTLWTNRKHATLAAHYIFLVIFKNNKLNNHEKKYLINYFSDILWTKDEGDMAGVVYKRTINNKNDICILGYDPLVERASLTATGAGVVGAVGYIASAETIPFFEYFSTGETTLFKNLNLFTTISKSIIDSKIVGEEKSIKEIERILREEIYNKKEINLSELFKIIIPNNEIFKNDLKIALSSSSENNLDHSKIDAIKKVKSHLETSGFPLISFLEMKPIKKETLIFELLSKLKNAEESKLILKLYFDEVSLGIHLNSYKNYKSLEDNYERFCAFISTSLKKANTPTKASLLCFKAMGLLQNLNDKKIHFEELFKANPTTENKGNLLKATNEYALCEKKLQTIILNSFRDKSSQFKILTKQGKIKTLISKFLLITLAYVIPLTVAALCFSGVGAMAAFILAVTFTVLRYIIFCCCDKIGYSENAKAYQIVSSNFLKNFEKK